ncbi:MLL3 [Lepeophtheirus salmonis]|uniref:MLL3 n=1 Tax=Lepeophtheirus salmonis TaxID=72036 RepID=A0A7R8H4T0_LEPSM|nr:MLL3 [Lepeophtheirus salmonis]CAF2851136.1 MLL3 [Lepeophtheirus salmonis]
MFQRFCQRSGEKTDLNLSDKYMSHLAGNRELKESTLSALTWEAALEPQDRMLNSLLKLLDKRAELIMEIYLPYIIWTSFCSPILRKSENGECTVQAILSHLESCRLEAKEASKSPKLLRCTGKIGNMEKFQNSKLTNSNLLCCTVCGQYQFYNGMHVLITAARKGGWQCQKCKWCQNCGQSNQDRDIFYLIAYRNTPQKDLIQCSRCRMQLHVQCDQEGTEKNSKDKKGLYACKACKSGHRSSSLGSSNASS